MKPRFQKQDIQQIEQKLCKEYKEEKTKANADLIEIPSETVTKMPRLQSKSNLREQDNKESLTVRVSTDAKLEARDLAPQEAVGNISSLPYIDLKEHQPLSQTRNMG